LHFFHFFLSAKISSEICLCVIQLSYQSDWIASRVVFLHHTIEMKEILDVLYVFRGISIKTTLNVSGQEGSGFLSKRMIYHGQRSFRTLIRASFRLFDPEFVCVHWRFTTHFDQVGVLCDIIVILLDLDYIRNIQVYLDTSLLVLSINVGPRRPSLVRCDEIVDRLGAIG
jgi:hypothetical protein